MIPDPSATSSYVGDICMLERRVEAAQTKLRSASENLELARQDLLAQRCRVLGIKCGSKVMLIGYQSHFRAEREDRPGRIYTIGSMGSVGIIPDTKSGKPGNSARRVHTGFNRYGVIWRTLKDGE